MTGALWLIAGLVGGAVHFALLRHNTSLYLSGSGLGYALGLHALRLAAIVLLLGFAARDGALPLLLAALGVISARPLVFRFSRFAS